MAWETTINKFELSIQVWSWLIIAQPGQVILRKRLNLSWLSMEENVSECSKGVCGYDGWYSSRSNQAEH